ncbi:MAG: hypothetical protein ACP5P4_05135 [Steroidobacteraceae bacterium]
MPGAPTPPLIQAAFANSAASGNINTIPVSSSGLAAGQASYELGFPPDTMVAPSAGGVDPLGQDFNGIHNAETANLLAWIAGQPWPFNATLAAAIGGYAYGAIVPMANGAGYWINQTAGNSNNPDTTAAASSGWAPLVAYGTVTVSGLAATNVTLTAPQAAMEQIVFTGTLTANIQVIFPTWVKRWTVINNTTGAFSLTAITPSGTGVIVPQVAGGGLLVYGDGANIGLLPQDFAYLLENAMLSNAVTLEPDPGGTPANGTPGSIVAYY